MIVNEKRDWDPMWKNERKRKIKKWKETYKSNKKNFMTCNMYDIDHWNLRL